MNYRAWIEAFRLRTLPLSLACIGMGNILAGFAGVFNWSIAFLSVLTTIFLQILSNLANDYGDSIHGADSTERTGPQRQVQSGAISKSAMKKAIYLFAGCSFICGLLLIKIALSSWLIFWIFLILGLLSIWAAINYTSGNNPYGYQGFGDLFVFLFFGWVGVVGTYFLQTLQIEWTTFLPASSCSFFAVAVLNINNIRDIESDEKAGKRSIPVRIGRNKAVAYHILLLSLGLLSAILFVYLEFNSYWQFLFLLVIPLLVINGKAVNQLKKADLLDPYLKQMALTTLLFVILFGIGHLI